MVCKKKSKNSSCVIPNNESVYLPGTFCCFLFGLPILDNNPPAPPSPFLLSLLPPPTPPPRAPPSRDIGLEVSSCCSVSALQNIFGSFLDNADIIFNLIIAEL